MRRNSLVGPLLIILVGVWFLMSSLRPEWPLLEMAAKFWPFVLMGWGFLRLVEILLGSLKGQPAPEAGLSSGEWTFIVFLCIGGSILFQVNVHRPWRNWGIHGNSVEIFGHGYDFTTPEQTAPAAKATKVIVENLRGTVRVTGEDVQEVKVSGRKSVKAIEDKDANAANEQTPIEITSQDGQIIVRTNQERVGGNQRVTTDLEVKVPRGVSVQVRGGREGDVEVGDITGGVEVSSDNAGVRLQNIGGNVRLDLQKSDQVRATNVKGNIEVQGGRGRDLEMDGIAGEITINGSFSGDLDLRNCAKPVKFQSPHTDMRVEKIPGQIHLDLGTMTASNVVGPIRLNSNRSRDVHLEQFTQAAELSLDKGDITLRPMTSPTPKIDARTHNGQIELSIPEGAKFDLKATTNRGDLNNDFGSPLRVDYNNSHRPDGGGTILGGVGAGLPITLSTDRGGIIVRKDLSALPSLPPRPPKAPEAPSAPSAPGGKIEIETH